MLLSVERPFVGAFAFHIPGGHAAAMQWSGAAVLPASTEHGLLKTGFVVGELVLAGIAVFVPLLVFRKPRG